MNKYNVFKMIKAALVVGILSMSFNSQAAKIKVAELGGVHVIKFSGEILEGDAYNFKRAIRLSAAKNTPIEGVILNSIGGDIEESYDMIDLILENKLSTIVPPGAECISACVGMFAAGVDRILHPRSKIGVHRINVNDEDTDSARSASVDMMDVYKDLEIPASIRLKMIETPPEEVTYLTFKEMKEFSSEKKFFESGASKTEIEKEIRKSLSEPVTAAGDFTNSAEQLRDKGIELIKAKKSDEAIVVLKKSLALNTDDPRTNYFLGLVHYNINDYAKAKNYFLAAVSFKNNYAVAWKGLGLIYGSEGKINDAADCFVSYFKFTSNKAKALETFSKWEEQASGKPLYKAIKLTKARLGVND